MRVDVVSLPTQLKPTHLKDRLVVVFDVLRATTTMVAALEAGVREIRVFPDIASVRQAKKKMPGALACGEQQCLKPEGFDLGNSPQEFSQQHIGKTLLMSTTNGTKAILAARGAARILAGAIVNGEVAARKVHEAGKDLTLLCAGTNGEPAIEDMIGAGMLTHFLGDCDMSDAAFKARELFLASRHDLPKVLRTTAGGQNLIRANLENDIDFAAHMNIFTAVGQVDDGAPIRIVHAR